MATTRILLASTSLALLSGSARAQTCMGAATFVNNRAQMTADIASGGNPYSVGAGASFGATPGPFAALGIGLAHDDNLSNNATVVDGIGGLGFPVLTTPVTEFCPFFRVANLNGVDDLGEHVSFRSYGVGLSLGTRLSVDPNLELVPFLGGAALLGQSTISLGSAVGTSEHDYFNVDLGMGFVIQSVFTIRPSVSYELAHGQTTSSYALRFSYSFGKVTMTARPRPAAGEGSLASVWANPREMIYYCSGSRWYGDTADGRFMTEREAIAAGYSAEHGKRC